MSLSINQSIVTAINNTIIDDHNKFLNSIFLKYGQLGNFSLQYLHDKYKIQNIIIPEPKINNKKKIVRKKTIIEPRFRCMARCWGGEKYVHLDTITKEWSLGYQCKRKKINNLDYCGIHQLEIDKGYLTHGRIDGDVPHPHYEKYKRKIEIKNALKKEQTSGNG